ncbi:MAG: DegT/DnrJ/EryC1/StrS family aminotransferase [Acidobacteria bacterium]|nr:DegT/DnrJ/EryC1/StrS family aminotransferase [Acidobacteriota bacterium]
MSPQTAPPACMTAYPLAANTLTEEEISAAKAVLESGLLTMGQEVQKFENAFASWVGAKYALMVNSGSSANLLMVDLMLRRSGSASPWLSGDEVLVPALAWPTTVWPLVQLGLTPVFVDVDPRTLAIDLDSARSVLGPKVKGMFLIHVLGQVPNVQDYLDFLTSHEILLIEDCCESLGGHFDGRHAGTFGVMGSFSFYFSHHLTTVEGGMVVTGDNALYDDLLSLRAHGWTRDRSDKARWKENYPDLDERFLFVTAGYNVRPTEIQGAIGSVQLRKLDTMIDARQRLAQRVHDWVGKYAPWLELIGAERLPTASSKMKRLERTHSWMMLSFRLGQNAPTDLARLKSHLESMRVETRPIIAGNLARHPAALRFKTRSAASLACCDDLLSRGFMIGCHPVLDEQVFETLEAAFYSLSKL